MKDHSFELLRIFYDAMVEGGVNHKIFRADIDENFVENINTLNKFHLSLEDCQKLADKCLANEWLERTVMGGKYIQLRLTTTGLGIVKSKLKQKEISQQRSILKKLSDYVNDHNGVFILLSFIVSFLSLFVAGIAIFVSLTKGN